MLVLSNSEIRALAATLRAELNTFSELRLYAPDLTPTPATRLIDLVEPLGSTYSVRTLTGLWTEPQKALEGLWYTEAAEVSWDPPAAIPWRAWGYYVASAARLVAVERFPAQVVMAPGDDPFLLTVRIYVANIWTVCDDPHFAAPPGP